MGDRDNYSFPGVAADGQIVPDKGNARQFCRASKIRSWSGLARHVIAFFGPDVQMLVISNDLDGAILPSILEL